MAQEIEAAVARSIRHCERSYGDKLHEWQDCVQGINLMKRVLRKKKVSEDTALNAASKVCAVRESDRGPRLRCREGAVTLALELIKGRQSKQLGKAKRRR